MSTYAPKPVGPSMLTRTLLVAFMIGVIVLTIFVSKAVLGSSESEPHIADSGQTLEERLIEAVCGNNETVEDMADVTSENERTLICGSASINLFESDRGIREFFAVICNPTEHYVEGINWLVATPDVDVAERAIDAGGRKADTPCT